MEFNKEIEFNSLPRAFEEYQNESCDIQNEIDSTISKITSILKETKVGGVYLDFLVSNESAGDDAGYVVALTADNKWYYRRRYNTPWMMQNGGIIYYSNTHGDFCIDEDDSYQVDINEVMMEFDFAATVISGQGSESFRFCCINQIQDLLKMNFTPSSSRVIRVNIKGHGLLERLNEVLKEIQIVKNRKDWKAQGLCQYCGGSIQGLFKKKCVKCGREKDYN